MAFKKGDPKPAHSGRKPGVANKKTILKTEEVLLNRSINPTEEILKLIPELGIRDQVEAWKYLHGFVNTKPKDMPEEQEAEVVQDEQLNTAQILNMVDVKKP